MDIPSWFQSAIQRRLDYVSARIEHHPDLRKYRAEEEAAFEALFTDVDKTQWPEFMEWEDKHHLKRAVENERLYLQGMRDGMQLVVALLSDPFAPAEEHRPKESSISASAKSEEAEFNRG
jgi:hypothetical protein